MDTLLHHDRAVGEILECAETGSAVSLAPITAAAGASYSLLFRMDRAGGVTEAACHGVDPRYLDRLKEASRLNLLPGWLGGLETGSVVDRAAFGSDRQFGRTDFCNHVVRPEGSFHCMIATPFACGADRFHLVIGRPRTHAEFDADSRRVVRWMLPHIAEVLRLQAHLAATRRDLDQAQRVLDGLDEAVFVVGRDATVATANVAARRLAARREAIALDPKGRLTAATPAETGHLRRSIDAAQDGEGKTCLLMPHGSDGSPLRLTISRLLGQSADPEQKGKVLVVADPGGTRDDDAQIVGMARLYGLTRREIEVVSQLARGATLKTAAHDLGMSYNTARTYVRKAFEKTAVHRQSDLLRLLSTGCHPVGRRNA